MEFLAIENIFGDTCHELSKSEALEILELCEEKNSQNNKLSSGNYKKPARKRKTEHDDLKVQVKMMEEEVNFLKQMNAVDAAFISAISPEASKWESIAKTMEMQKLNVLMENTKLKKKVKEQEEFMELLKTMFSKRPRLVVLYRNVFVCWYYVLRIDVYLM